MSKKFEHGWIVIRRNEGKADVVMTPRPYQSRAVAEQYMQLLIDQGDRRWAKVKKIPAQDLSVIEV